MKILLRLLPLLLALAAGCSGPRKAADTAPGADATTLAARIGSHRQSSDNLTARLRLELSQGERRLSCGGTLRMRRDDVVQMVLTVLGFEVGRIEFSPADVLLIDKIHSQYVRASYSDLDFLRRTGLDFYSLQALFRNELFVPGSRSAEGQAGRFRVSAEGDHTRLSLTDTPALQYDFLVATAGALIDRVTAQSRAGAEDGRLTWEYADFQSVGGQPFPATMTARFAGQGHELGLRISLSRLGTGSDWKAHTTPKTSYTRRSAADILRALTQMP